MGNCRIDSTILKKAKRLWQNNHIYSVLLVLLLMLVIQSLVFTFNGNTADGVLRRIGLSWMNILRNNTYAGIIALGMCFAVVSGGIDLSVGSMLCALGAVVMYLIEPNTGLLAGMGITGPAAYIIAIALTLLVGCLLGGLNGVLVAYGKVPSFVATLGTMKIFRSVTQQLTKAYNPRVPDGFKSISGFKIGGQVFLPVLYWLALVLLMHLLFKKTAFGRQVIAIGSNEKAAQLSGIAVKRKKCLVYVLVGALTAAAAVLYVSRIGSMDYSDAGSGYEMDAISAVVVGGTSMRGGKGSVLCSFLGMLIMGVMNNILNTVGIPTFLCEAVKGAIIIFAVLMQKKEDT